MNQRSDTITSTSRTAELERNERLLALLQSKVGSLLTGLETSLGDVVAILPRKNLLDLARLLKIDTEFQFNLLVDITAVDWLDAREERFEMVYHLASLTTLYRLRLKVPVPEENPEVPSIVSLWSGANFMEREVWDMYGIKFTGHPDLRRILLYEEFKGFPLRKDYPVQGKQPRIALRSPEVRNTALDMKRDPLVKINPRRRQQGDSAPGDSGRFVSSKWE